LVAISTSSSNLTLYDYRAQLARLTAECERLPQRWQLPAAAIDPSDDNDDRSLNTCPHFSDTVSEIPNISSLTTPFDYRVQLDTLTAECERTQQRWPFPAAAVALPDDDDRPLNTCSYLSDTVSEISNISSLSTPFDYRVQLAAAECERRQQRWPFPAAAFALPDDDDEQSLNTCPHLSTDSTETHNLTQPTTTFRENADLFDYCSQIADKSCRTVQLVDSSPSIRLFLPADLSHEPTNMTLTAEDSLRNPAACKPITDLTSILAQLTRLLVEQKRQSTTLRHLAELSKKLCERMSLLLRKLSIPDPCPSSNHYAPKPLSHPSMAPANIKPTTVAVNAIQPNLPYTPHPDKLLPPTEAPPWPPPSLACLLQPIQPSKSLPCKNLIWTKLSVDRGRPAMSWSKDCLCPP